MSDKITIIRATKDKDNPYVIVRKSVTQDKTLSWEARGVLIYLLGKPDDWKVKPKDLEQQCKGAKVYRILNELIDAGYIVRDTLRDEQQRFIEWVYYVYEVPQPPKQEPLPEKPEMAQPDMENQDSTNKGTIPSKESTKKDSTPPASGDVGSDAIGEQPITEDDVVVVPVDGLPDETVSKKEHLKTKPVFDMVALCSFGIPAGVKLDKTSGARIGMIASWLYKEQGLTETDSDAIQVKAFYDWYDRENQGATRPKDKTKFGEHWLKWKANGSAKAARPIDTNANIEFASPEQLVQDTLDEMNRT